MPDVRTAICDRRMSTDRPSSQEPGTRSAPNPVSHLWARRVVVTAACPQGGHKTKGGELTVNLLFALAALMALSALGKAVRVIASILAWLIAIAFAMTLGMLVLLELAKHVRLL
jgi:hypothetical protein